MEVKLRRIERQYLQGDLAAALEMDRSRLSAIERGKIPPRLVRAHEIAAFQRVLGLDPQIWLRPAAPETAAE